MSEYHIASQSAPPPPTTLINIVTDNGTIIPSANIDNFNGGFTSANNAKGFQVIANPNGSNNGVFELTNRLGGSSTTVGATTANVVTFPLGAVPGTFFFNFQVALYNASGPAGGGYETYTTIRTDGATATIIDATDSITQEDATLVATTAQMVVVGNTAIFQVGGVVGLTIDWVVVGTYVEAN